MVSPKLTGEVSEYRVISYLLEKGFKVYDGCSENDKVDLVVDDNGLKKAQVKTARLKEGKLIVPVSSTRVNMSETSRENYTSDDIDFFLAYCPEIDKCYKIPVEETGKCSMTLRLEETKNNQFKRVNWAEDYEI